MAERIVKFRLITWFEDVPDPVHSGGTSRVERINHMGDKVDITDEASLKRLDDLGALYTEKEAAAIEAGTYTGEDAGILAAARTGSWRGPATVTAAEGEHGDVASMDAATLGEYIRENELTVDETLSLLPANADEDTINKFLDAENIATENEPRSGVTDRLEAQLNASTQQQTGSGVNATDAARAAAADLGVDLSAINGTGTGGRITVEDVKAAAE